MWERARRCSRARSRVSLDETAAAVRLLAERARVVAEGAGALALAAALSGRAGAGRIVCIVSGGNIDAARLGGDPRRAGRRLPSSLRPARPGPKGSSSSHRSYGVESGNANHASANPTAAKAVTRAAQRPRQEHVGDEEERRRDRDGDRGETADREAVGRPQHPLLVLLTPAQPVIGARRDEEDRSRRASRAARSCRRPSRSGRRRSGS